MDISARPQRLRPSASRAPNAHHGVSRSRSRGVGDKRQSVGRLAHLDEWLYRTAQSGPRAGIVVARLAGAVVACGLVWPTLSATLLVVASATHWLVVPLIQTTNAWGLPINLGWGETVYLSYGLLTVALAVALLAVAVYSLRDLNWAELAAGATPARRLSARTLAWLTLGGLLTPALFLFQALFVDMRLITALAAQENDHLLIALHLGYKVAPQHFKMIPFEVQTATPLDRLTLLAQSAGVGVVAMLLAWLPCLYGLYLVWRAEWSAQRSATRVLGGASADAMDDAGDEQGDDADGSAASHAWAPVGGRARWRLAVVVAAVVVAVALVGRAPAGVFCEYLGTVSIESGDYTSALNWLSAAQTLDPSLADLSEFHQQRGEALYESGARSGMDVGLYLAAQYRTLGALDQAWLQDQALYARYAQTPVVIQDITLTLEAEAEVNTRVPYTYDTNTTPQPLRQDALQPIGNANATATAVDQALPWLNRLLALAPNNIYGHYLRGRIYLTTHTYDAGASDFQSVITLTHDRDMLSAAYTYLAFCRAGQGDWVSERALLYHAVELDHGYYNNTAREALSGLH